MDWVLLSDCTRAAWNSVVAIEVDRDSTLCRPSRVSHVPDEQVRVSHVPGQLDDQHFHPRLQVFFFFLFNFLSPLVPRVSAILRWPEIWVRRRPRA
jgi:hypothetical protein